MFPDLQRSKEKMTEKPDDLYPLILEAFERLDNRCRSENVSPVQIDSDQGDSILEERFWQLARKTREAGWMRALSQYKVSGYIADAMFETECGITLIELDGKAFHDRERDLFRDRNILKNNRQVHQIIRIPYAAMTHYGRAVFKILEHWEPAFALRQDLSVMDAEDYFLTELPTPDDCSYASLETWLRDASKATDLYLIERTANPKFAWVGSARDMINFEHRGLPIVRLTRESISNSALLESQLAVQTRRALVSTFRDRFDAYNALWKS